MTGQIVKILSNLYFVNSNGNIECQLDDDTCNKIRSIIDSYRELQAMRK